MPFRIFLLFLDIVYGPSYSSPVSDLELFSSLKSIMNTYHYSSIVIFGDFNYSSFKWPLHVSSDTHSCNHFSDFLNKNKLVQVVVVSTSS